MTFSDFFQQNILFFVAAAAVLAFLIILEIRGLGSRGVALSPAALTQRINAGGTLIDLRQKSAFDSGRIAGAKNIQLSAIVDHMTKLGKLDEPITLYCYRGFDSGKALAKLKKAGFTDVSHLQGGMGSWDKENLPKMKS